MGVIKKLIGGLFAFLGGFLKGLFSLAGIGKKSEYFLEYEDANAQSGANQLASFTPAKREAEKAEPSKAESVKVTAAQAKSANQDNSVKTESLNGKTPATTKPEATPAPQPVGVASKTEPGQTFAPNFLITPSSNNGRRRPGPSLNRFMDMAKQVKPST